MLSGRPAAGVECIPWQTCSAQSAKRFPQNDRRTHRHRLSPSQTASTCDEQLDNHRRHARPASYPKGRKPCAQAAADNHAFAYFPVATGKRSGQTNPLERLNKESKRQHDVVGVFPPAALFTAGPSVLVEATECRSPKAHTSRDQAYVSARRQ
ncbi:transposase [Mycobacterium avium subsp. hominissuis]|uniref:transposase n=1 Tax=Mycobacterium avium TaxID=1764 RepID=UPI001C6A3B37|nr:transposase [Mycobacterium avium subsp. hominissuis]